MAVLAVVTSSPAGVEGGHLVVARSLVNAAREQGHDAHLVLTPDYGFGRTLETYRANWSTDVSRLIVPRGRTVDQVISLRYPSYAVSHSAHVCWLNHTMREYYDQWPRFAASISWRNRMKERTRKVLIRAADWWLLHYRVNEVVAQSRTIQRRLRDDLSVRADVLWPPPPPRAYRCDEYGDYILAISRLTPMKRLDLLIRALAEPAAKHIRVVIAGDGESRADLEALATSLGVAGRVALVGHLDDAALAAHLGRCRAVCFPPLSEDYGFVTVEAFASRKAVVTCADSGGPAELVRDGDNGLVCEPTPASLAVGLARIMEDRVLAERLGRSAAAQAAGMKWPDAVKRLVIV
jgi:glycosyltransferase involved in cell wall biosynthesis